MSEETFVFFLIVHFLVRRVCVGLPLSHAVIGLVRKKLSPLGEICQGTQHSEQCLGQLHLPLEWTFGSDMNCTAPATWASEDNRPLCLLPALRSQLLWPAASISLLGDCAVLFYFYFIFPEKNVSRIKI